MKKILIVSIIMLLGILSNAQLVSAATQYADLTKMLDEADEVLLHHPTEYSYVNTTKWSGDEYDLIDNYPSYQFWKTDHDHRYYKFIVQKDADITITLSSLPSGTNYDIKLYTEDAGYLGRSVNSGTTTETISKNLAPGVYYIFVYSYDGYNNSDTFHLSVDYTKESYATYRLDMMQGTYDVAVWESDLLPKDDQFTDFNLPMECTPSDGAGSTSPRYMDMQLLDGYPGSDKYNTRTFFIINTDLNDAIKIALEEAITTVEWDSFVEDAVITMSFFASSVVITGPTGGILSTVFGGFQTLSGVVLAFGVNSPSNNTLQELNSAVTALESGKVIGFQQSLVIYSQMISINDICQIPVLDYYFSGIVYAENYLYEEMHEFGGSYTFYTDISSIQSELETLFTQSKRSWLP